MAEEVKPAAPQPQAPAAEPAKAEPQHELEAEVLAHQIDGVMFHIDAVMLYKLIDMPQMKKLHMKRVTEESDANMMTACNLIDRYDEIIDPTQVSRETSLSRLRYAARATHTDKAVINQKIITAWMAWEEKTRDMYVKAVQAQPDCKMWARLHKDVEKELKVVEKLRKKYMTAKAY